MLHSMRGRLLLAAGFVLLAAAMVAVGSSAKNSPNKLDKINHIVVIYEENHSFDNLYGTWEGVDGVANADAAHTTQLGQNGAPYTCLTQNDVNLAPLAAACVDGYQVTNAFPN